MTGMEAVPAQTAVPRIPGTGKPGPRSDMAMDADPEGRENGADFPACFAQFAEEGGGGSASARAGQQGPAGEATETPGTGGWPVHIVTEAVVAGLAADKPAPRIQASGLWPLAGDTIAPVPADLEPDGGATDTARQETDEPRAVEKPARETGDGNPPPSTRTGTEPATGAVAVEVLPKDPAPQPPHTAVVASEADSTEEPVHDLLAELLSAAKATKQSGSMPPQSNAGDTEAPPPPAEPVMSEVAAPQNGYTHAPPVTAAQTPQPPSVEPAATRKGVPPGRSVAPVAPRHMAPLAGTDGETMDDAVVEPLSASSGDGDAENPVMPQPRHATDAAVAPGSSGSAKEGSPPGAGKNTPPPVRRDPQMPVDRAGERGPRPDTAPAIGLQGTPTAAVTADARETARDPSILAMGHVTAVRQENHFAPVMTPQSPAQQIAERITAELTADPPPAAGRSSAAAETQSQPVKVLHIQLNPPELGPLTVRMAMRNGALDLRMVVESPETARLLTGDREAISGVLRVAGYMVDGVSVQTAIATRPEASSLFGDSSAGAQQQQQGQTAQGWQQSGGDNPGQPWQRGGGGQETLAGTGDETGEDGGAQRTGGALYL